MAIHIALLVKSHLAHYCEQNFPKNTGHYVVSYHCYETLTELQQLYLSLIGQVDGVVTSGLVPHTYLQQLKIPNGPILSYFHFDIENTYRIILRESVQRQHLELSRVGTDFLPAGVSLQQVLEDDDMPQYVRLFEQHLCSLSQHELETEEAQILEGYRNLYQAGQLDYVLTYFYSCVVGMADWSIDCHYLYPSESEYHRVMDHLCQEANLLQAERSSPAVIHLSLTHTNSRETQYELRLSEFHISLLDFLRQRQYDASIKQGSHYFELYTDFNTLETMTNHFTVCPLRTNLPLVGQLCQAVGYGTGQTFFKAKQNAMEAVTCALNLKLSNLSVHLDDSGHLNQLPSGIQQKATALPFGITKQSLLATAEQAKLSPETISRIYSVISATGSDSLTSQELIERLGLSLRTANRYLAHLVQANLAYSIGQKPTMTKGRPQTIYSLTPMVQALCSAQSEPNTTTQKP